MNMLIMRTKYFFAAVVSVLLFMSGCTEQQEYELLSGDLVGYVRLFKASQYEISNRAGVTVTADNGVRQVSVTTDEEGRYIFAGLETGSYNIFFSKDGYCQHMKAGVQFVGGDVPAYSSTVSLYSLPEMTISNLILEEVIGADDYTYLEVRFSSSGETDAPFAHCRYYLAKGRDVSFKNYTLTGYRAYGRLYVSVMFGLSLDKKEYPAGSEISIVICPASDDKNSYIDPATGMKIFTSLSTSNATNVLTVTLPVK